VRVEGGFIGLDAYVASPTGKAIYAFNEAESGNAYGVYAENVSPNGIAIYGLASNGSRYSTGIGVYGRSNSDDGAAGVYGEATATVGISYGVHGVSATGDGVRGEQTASGNYGLLGGDEYGVEGYGNSAGGHFEDADGTSSVDVAWGYFGINAEGSLGGGVFSDSDGSANADVAHGDRGLRAGGSEYGGQFHDTDNSGQAYVGYGDRGIEAEGSDAGGYFENSTSGNYGAVGTNDRGVTGVATTIDGHGVHGFASANSGAGCGVYAETSSPTGYSGFFVGGRNYFQGPVGIGITEPAEELHVVGDIHATETVTALADITTSADLIVSGDVITGGDYTYSSPKTSYLNIPGCGLQSVDPSDDDLYAFVQGYGYVRPGSVPPYDLTLCAPVCLPDGVRVEEFRIYFYDNDAAADVDIVAYILARMLDTGGVFLVADITTSSSGSSTDIQSAYDDTISSHGLVNNQNSQYIVEIDWEPGDSGTDIRVYGFRIEYSRDKLP
jgi:hypothetical protein